MQSDSTKYRLLRFLGFSHYRVGDDGSVWSCRRTPIWKRLTPQYCGSYLHVTLCLNNRREVYGVAELVLLAFVGLRPRGFESCHFPDPNPENNRLRNLTWGSRMENQHHRKVHGTDNSGERSGRAILTEQDVLMIRNSEESNPVLAVRLGVHPQTVWCVRRGISWRCLDAK